MQLSDKNTKRDDGRKQSQGNVVESVQTAVSSTVAQVDDKIRMVINETTHLATGTVKLATDLAVIPPLKPIPFNWFLLLSLITALPIAGFNVGFAGMGWGRECMKFAIEHKDVGAICMSASFFVFATLYILDFSYWESKCMSFIRASFLILGG